MSKRFPIPKKVCVCPSKPSCSYPHIFPLGVKQEVGRNAKRPHIEAENRNVYEVDITTLHKIDPLDYLRTTGDLATKLKVLEQDAFNLAFAAKKLHNLAKKTQGDSQYLETTFEDGKLTCQPKTTKVERAKRKGDVYDPHTRALWSKGK